MIWLNGLGYIIVLDLCSVSFIVVLITKIEVFVLTSVVYAGCQVFCLPDQFYNLIIRFRFGSVVFLGHALLLKQQHLSASLLNRCLVSGLL
jgi:hypothetical protein